MALRKGNELREACFHYERGDDCPQEGKIILVAQMNKNKKFQKEQLGKEGYSEFKEFYKEDLKH